MDSNDEKQSVNEVWDTRACEMIVIIIRDVVGAY